MSRYLILEEILDGEKHEIARIQAGEVVIGRSPDEGITLDHQAVSSNHGRFLRVRNHWFYKDLGSTNGSWINGTAVDPDNWRLIRPGDYLQLADVGLQLGSEAEAQSQASITGFPAFGGRSLIIFSNAEFQDEFPVPEYGRALVIGGTDCDLDIPGDIYELPSLVIERRGEGVCAFSVAKQLPILHEGDEVKETVALSDRDIVTVSDFKVIYNDPSEGKSRWAQNFAEGGADGGGPDGPVKGWGAERTAPDLTGDGVGAGSGRDKPHVNPMFGKGISEEPGVDDTVMIDRDEMEYNMGGDVHPSMRHTYEDPGDYSFSSLEDRIIILAGFIFMMVLMLFVVAYFFIL